LAPILNSVSPNSYSADNLTYTMQLFGSNFQAGDTLTFTFPDATTHPNARSINFISANEIDYQFNDGSEVGPWRVQVNAPDGTHSSAVSFSVPAPNMVDALYATTVAAQIGNLAQQYRAVGFYLGRPSPPFSVTNAQQISGSGRSLVSIYEHNQSFNVPSYFANPVHQADIDATAAISAALAIGQSPGSAIYFAVDQEDTHLTSADLANVDTYFRELSADFGSLTWLVANVGPLTTANPYSIGIYAGGGVLSSVRSEARPNIQYYWFDPHLNGSFSGAQIVRNVNGQDIDTDTTLATNFGQWSTSQGVRFTVSSKSGPEGSDLTFRISIQNPSYASVSDYLIYYNTSDGTATAGSDYTGIPNQVAVHFTASSAQFIDVTVHTLSDNNPNEGSETFNFNIYDFQHTSLSSAQGTITDVVPSAPEITVIGNAVNILDNDTSPSSSDGTDFGSVTQGGAAVQHTFTVRNDGTAPLTTSNLVVPSGFSLVEGLSSPIPVGGSDTFTVQLNTATTGPHSGQISFSDNDSDENPFSFSITGTVNATPTTARTLQPGPESQDEWITNTYSFNDNYGVDNDRLRVGGWGDLYNSLIRFDLTNQGLPTHVTSATLRLYNIQDLGTSATGMYVDELHTGWDENYGWYDHSLSYTNISQTNAPGAGWFDIDVTQEVNDWLANPTSNFGLQLRPLLNNNNFNDFVSSDATGAYLADRPELVLTYSGGGNLAAHDFDGGGTSDLVWRNNASGAMYEWSMSGASIASSGYVYSLAPSTWTEIAEGDFSGDHRTDLMWRDTSGNVYEWTMNGASIVTSNFLAIVLPAGWSLRATADFNGDGTMDLLWQNSAGDLYEWQMSNGTVASSRFVYNLSPSSWTLVTAADFDGDHNADLLWRNNTSGAMYEWSMNGTSIGSSNYVYSLAPSTWAEIAAADFSGDGRTDLMWRNTSGAVYEWSMNGASITASNFLATAAPGVWSVRATGNFNSDSTTDILWQSSAGDLYEWQMANGTVASSDFVHNLPPSQWNLAGTGDFDGDHRTDLMWQNAASGELYEWSMNGAQIASSGYVFGLPTSQWSQLA
jgi:hypothetical protein